MDHSKCTCGHFACVCDIRATHEEGCLFRRAAAGSIGIACDHGYDVCPTCDPCTCDLIRAGLLEDEANGGVPTPCPEFPYSDYRPVVDVKTSLL